MRPVLPALGLVTLIAVAGCGNSGSGGSAAPAPTTPTGTSQQTAATAAITTAWTTFFHTGTKPAVAEQLLQNGGQMGPAIKVAAKVQKREKVAEDAKVTKVTFASPTAATVTYDLLSHGSTLLPGATGQAVLVDGRWKVSTETFCTLVELGAGGEKVPGC